MYKPEFLTRLREGLAGLPQQDIEERVTFYREMIDDRVEDGLSEEEAVAEIGPVEQITAQIIRETPITRLVKEKLRPKRQLSAGVIVLLVLGFPLWFPLLIAAFAVVFSLYIVLWTLVACLWVIFVSFPVGAIGAVVGCILLILRGDPSKGILLLGAALVLAGLAVFLFFGCMAATKGAVVLTKKIALWIKSLFVGKEHTK